MRFKRYDFPWVKVPLKNLLKFQNGINADSSKYGKGTKYISVTDILNNKYITYENIKGLINIDEATKNRFLVEYGDILFQRSSETFLDIGRSNVYLDKESSATFGGFVIRGKKINDYDPLFFKYLLDSTNSRKKIIKMGAGAQHFNIGQEGLESIELYFPCKSEQIKIGELFSYLDDRIIAQKKIISNLKSLIISIKNTEFYNTKGFKEKLENILIEINEKTIINDQHEVLSSTVKGIFKQSDYFDRAVASENNIGYKIVKRGNIVVSPQNLWMGNISYNDKFDIGIVSPSYKIFNISSNYNERYIFEMLTTKKSLYLFKTVSEQGASVVRRNLNYEAFMQLTFNIPSLNEQNNFIEKLSLLQNKLSLENKILSLLEQQKQYLLDKLFI